MEAQVTQTYRSYLRSECLDAQARRDQNKMKVSLNPHPKQSNGTTKKLMLYPARLNEKSPYPLTPSKEIEIHFAHIAIVTVLST